MNQVDVVMPTLKHDHAFEALRSLVLLPFPIRLHVITEGTSWPTAVNQGIRESSGDVLLMDDDLMLLCETFKHFEKYYPCADIFGFKMVLPDGRLEYAAEISNELRAVYTDNKEQIGNRPLYVPTWSASLLYIKKHVFEKIGLFEENWPGMYFEDTDFNYRAIKAGFKILYLPNVCLHKGAATKKSMSEMNAKTKLNHDVFQAKYLRDPEFLAELAKYPKELES